MGEWEWGTENGAVGEWKPPERFPSAYRKTGFLTHSPALPFSHSAPYDAGV